MSKAFKKESETGQELELDQQSDLSRKGAKNYMTPAGALKLQIELRKLKFEERPSVVDTVAWAAGNGDRSENADYTYGKKRLRQIDRRIEFLVRRLESAEVIDPTTVEPGVVRFGATVTIRDEEDRQRRYSIVGIDEVDVTKGRISWASPLANALMRHKEGDIVVFNSPKGEQEVELVKIEYIEIG